MLFRNVSDMIKLLSDDDIEDIKTVCDNVLDSREKQTGRQLLLKEVL